MARDALAILGRTVGTFDGWDQVADQIMVFHKFEPIPELEKTLPAGELAVNYDGGYFEYYDDQGNPIECVDIIDTLKPFQKKG